MAYSARVAKIREELSARGALAFVLAREARLQLEEMAEDIGLDARNFARHNPPHEIQGETEAREGGVTSRDAALPSQGLPRGRAQGGARGIDPERVAPEGGGGCA